ncbi:hypothetical protein EVAR_40821_1 [Eumeta japonica]|uniref:Uncharacterized protein n=1 Tax=Eumeta variegata TaxID=151549 RepID=A0A4C1WIV9_EUMVA|nr:hypothetical protein EVAR_40821_1 [Eumeta japonica]
MYPTEYSAPDLLFYATAAATGQLKSTGAGRARAPTSKVNYQATRSGFHDLKRHSETLKSLEQLSQFRGGHSHEKFQWRSRLSTAL